jgi:hypothetical protein
MFETISSKRNNKKTNKNKNQYFIDVYSKFQGQEKPS